MTRKDRSPSFRVSQNEDWINKTLTTTTTTLGLVSWTDATNNDNQIYYFYRHTAPRLLG